MRSFAHVCVQRLRTLGESHMLYVCACVSIRFEHIDQCRCSTRKLLATLRTGVSVCFFWGVQYVVHRQRTSYVDMRTKVKRYPNRMLASMRNAKMYTDLANGAR